MAEKTAIYNLNSGVVLDRSVFVQLPRSTMQETIAKLIGGAPPIVCDNADEFFTIDNLASCIVHKDVTAKVINDKLGVFNENQIGILLNGAAPVAGGDLVINLGNEQPGAPAAGYKFAKLPHKNWSVGTHMSLGPNRIKRKIKSVEGDGTLFWMSPKDYESLWYAASACWAGIPGVKTQFLVNTGMGKKTATVIPDCISVGGNFIRRYEIEQVAKYRGWVFPQLQAA